MKTLIKNGYAKRLTITLICSIALLFPLAPADLSGESSGLSSAPQETLRLGARIYREGILPSGERLKTSIKGAPSVPGTTFACISCHLRSGIGALDEGVYTPSINGSKLFRPLPKLYLGVEQKTDSLPPLRPAYTDESLVAAIRNGTDPTGRILNDIMPRYLLEDRDAKFLIAYLKSLSSQFSPGVSDTEIRFATVISENIKPEITEAMLISFNHYFSTSNAVIKAANNPEEFGPNSRPKRFGPSSRLMMKSMTGSWGQAARTMSLARWTLKGPPETWRRQLEEYNRKEPVFALLGGMVDGEWRPVHQFCEDNGIPCLFPNTDLPVISDSDWYTLYLSQGYYQEGESAARYLDSKEGFPPGGRPVVQVVRASRESEALAAGFQQTWQELGRQALVTVPLPPGNVMDGDFLRRVIAREKPAALVIWDDATALPALELLSRSAGRPEIVILSARTIGKSIWTLKESIRDFTYLTYPFAFAPALFNTAMGQQQKVLDDLQKTLKQADIPLKDEKQKVVSMTNSLTRLLTFMMMDLKGNYYRDSLLDVMGMMKDQPHPLFGRISFGAGRRYASRGCFIVQLSKGDDPELIKKSGWEIH